MATREALNHYEVLGVDPKASFKDIRSAYLKGLKHWHPDTASSFNIDRSEAHAKSLALNLAYAVLRDPVQRQAYDKEFRPFKASSRNGYVQEVRLRSLRGLDTFLDFVLAKARHDLELSNVGDSHLRAISAMAFKHAEKVSQEFSPEIPLFIEVVAHEAILLSAKEIMTSASALRLEAVRLLIAASKNIRSHLPAYALIALTETRDLSLGLADLVLEKAPNLKTPQTIESPAPHTHSYKCSCGLKLKETFSPPTKDVAPASEPTIPSTPSKFNPAFKAALASAANFQAGSYPSVGQVDEIGRASCRERVF